MEAQKKLSQTFPLTRKKNTHNSLLVPFLSVLLRGHTIQSGRGERENNLNAGFRGFFSGFNIEVFLSNKENPRLGFLTVEEVEEELDRKKP